MQHKRRINRGFGLLCAICAFVILMVAYPVTPASAAGCTSSGMSNRSFNVKYTSVNDQWVGGFNTARSRWNSAGVGASIGYSGRSTANMTAGRYSDSWFGLYIPRNDWGNTFTIKVNARALSASSASNQYWNWVLSTSTHELGHSLRLPDNPIPGNPNGSLMNHSRNRNTVGWPTSYDKSFVRRCF